MLIQALLVASTISLAACDRSPCCLSSSEDTKTVEVLTPKQLHTLITDGHAPTIVDANPKKIFDEGHVPGARWLASERVRDVLPSERDAHVVFYCYSETCGASDAAAKEALAAGWTHVARMNAGITGWKAAGLPIER